MRINTNMAAMNAWKALETNQANLQGSLERLSSGYRVNRAADDAAGLAVSEKLKAQIRGTNIAVRNTQDAISLVQTAEGGAANIQEMLQRMRELGVQASSSTLSDDDRGSLKSEFTELQLEITRTATSVKFNGTSLLDNTTALTFQVGANNGDTITTFKAVDLKAATLTVDAATIKIDTITDAQTALTNLDTALKTVSTNRATMGAMQNRLTNIISNLQTQSENLTSANSRIRDVDMANEMATFTKYQVLSQASTAMLAQANQLPQGILSLLR